MESPEVSDAETKHYAEIGLTPEGVCRKAYVPDQIKADSEKRTATFVISTGAVDRDRDTIKVDGWDVRSYLKNPVVLFAHRSDMLPIAKATSVVKTAGALKATAEFPPVGMHPLSDTVFSMLEAGFLRATSVGFRPKYDDSGRPKLSWNDQRGGIDFEEQELLEFSVVPVPSNPQALMETAKDFAGAKAAGIDLAPIRKAMELADEAYSAEGWKRADAEVARTATVELVMDGRVLAREQVKAGRRLSAKTETSIKSAHESASAAVAHLEAVLGEATDEAADDGKTPALVVTASPQAERILVSPDDVRAAVVAAVSATVRAEVNRLRGRLD